MEAKKIDKFIDNCSQVKLFYFDEEINCQILKQSKKLIMVRDIKDWHYDAYMIFPKKYIKKIKYGKLEKCREKILPPLKKEQFTDKIDKIDLSNLKNALKSLVECNQGICIENVTESKYMFVLGIIKELKSKKIIFKEVDLCGELKKEYTAINYKEITSVFYGDEYSTKLIEYANKKKRI
jgi:hypothetical protein